MTHHHRRGLKEVANAISDFHPLATRGNLGQTLADQLVDLGLAERGPYSPAYAARGYSIGYRLTDAGWRAI
jgi:hypothetical protein